MPPARQQPETEDRERPEQSEMGEEGQDVPEVDGEMAPEGRGLAESSPLLSPRTRRALKRQTQ